MSRKSVGLAIIMLLVFTISVSALELTGDIWILQNPETPATEDLGHMQRAEFTLLGIGPIRLMSEFEFAGDRQRIADLFHLLRDNLDADSIGALDQELYVVGGMTSRARVDWPLLVNGISVIGSVGYRVSGNVFKADGATEVESGIYHGLTYAGGVGMELIRSLRISAIYEIGPSLQTLHGNDQSAMWTGWDLGLDYRIPFFVGKAGYRSQELDPETDKGFKLGGPYISVGIHF